MGKNDRSKCSCITEVIAYSYTTLLVSFLPYSSVTNLTDLYLFIKVIFVRSELPDIIIPHISYLRLERRVD